MRKQSNSQKVSAKAPVYCKGRLGSLKNGYICASHISSLLECQQQSDVKKLRLELPVSTKEERKKKRWNKKRKRHAFFFSTKYRTVPRRRAATALASSRPDFRQPSFAVVVGGRKPWAHLAPVNNKKKKEQKEKEKEVGKDPTTY